MTVNPAAAQSVAAEQTITFAVDNMTCALCPITVKRAMAGVEGVRTVKIDFAARTATVIFDTAATSANAIATASANAGYPARIAG
nr:cation transporter [Yoonia sp.]